MLHNHIFCHFTYIKHDLLALVFAKSLQLLGDPQPGLRPCTPLGDFHPQTPCQFFLLAFQGVATGLCGMKTRYPFCVPLTIPASITRCEK